MAHGKNTLGRACPGVRATCVPTSELENPEAGEAHWPTRKSEARKDSRSVLGGTQHPLSHRSALELLGAQGGDSQRLHKEVRRQEGGVTAQALLQRSLQLRRMRVSSTPYTRGRHRCSSEQSRQGPVPLKKPKQTVYRKMAICKTTRHTAGASLLPPPAPAPQNAARRERAPAGYIKALSAALPVGSVCRPPGYQAQPSDWIWLKIRWTGQPPVWKRIFGTCFFVLRPAVSY